MQGGRGGRDPFFDFGSPFSGFGALGGFGGHRSLVSSFFRGRDPFDDPFFTHPFGSMFQSGLFGSSRNSFMNAHASGFLENDAPQPKRSRGPIIEELTSDDEKEEEKKKKNNPRKHGRSNKEPYVEDPDDVEERKSNQMQYINDFGRVNNMHLQQQNHSFTFQSSTVTYGGPNGAYYTSSSTRRTGSDGLTLEESKEANKATGQASHRVSRGIHDKGHSITRKLNSDGRVDNMQTLHNLNEDELAGFDESWKGNAQQHLPGWNEGLSLHYGMGSGSGQNGQAGTSGWALPSPGHHEHAGAIKSTPGAGISHPYSSGMSNRKRSRSVTSSNMDEIRKH